MVKNGFVKKNVGTLTLGERIGKLRSEKRIALGEVSKSTKIQVKYLEYLENGQYGKLPADVYVRGFLRSYAQYLGVDENYLIKLYDREKEIHNNIKKEEPGIKKNLRPMKFSRLVFTPKILVAVLIVFFIGLGFFYLYRELSIFISNPRLAIIEPLDNFSTAEKAVKVEGLTEKDSKLLINGQQVIVDENGKFSEVLVLQPGLNKIAVKAVNRFDKESEKIITGEATFENTAAAEIPLEEQNQESSENSQEKEDIKVKAAIYGDTKSASIIVKVDGAEVFSGVISPGETKEFEARDKISVSADKGKYVGVRINDKDMGMLDKDTKAVDDRIFTFSQQ